jgi:hypothetical protein
MTPAIAAILVIGFVTPIVAGLLFPRWLLWVFEPLWTTIPPVAITYYSMAPGPGEPGYQTTEALVLPLMIFLFLLVGPWIAWSRTVFRLLRERRAGIRHDPREFP